jgi:RNA polymerase primary sigma factor
VNFRSESLHDSQHAPSFAWQSDDGPEGDSHARFEPGRSDMPGVATEDEDQLDPETTAAIYLRDISRVPLLTAEEEIMLAKARDAGDEAAAVLGTGAETSADQRAALEESVRLADEARRRLTESNLRLVVSVARKYASRGLPLLDLVQEGNIGLARAVEKYDWHRGYRFSTYAYWWIRQAVTRAIADQSRTIRVPVHMVELMSDVHNAARDLQQALGREAGETEIAQALGTDVDRVRLILRAAKQTISLETPLGADGDSTVADMITDRESPAPQDLAVDALLRDDVEVALSALTPRERQVVRLRFGLLDGHDRTLGEIGTELGLSRERVRQIEADAFTKLRKPALRRQLRDYLDA